MMTKNLFHAAFVYVTRTQVKLLRRVLIEIRVCILCVLVLCDYNFVYKLLIVVCIV